MGIFSKKQGTPFSDEWDTSIQPTIEGDDEIYATCFGSSTFICTIPNSSGIQSAKWHSDAYGSRIIVLCKDWTSYVVYEDCVLKSNI